MTGFVLIMTGFVLNITVFFLNTTKDDNEYNEYDNDDYYYDYNGSIGRVYCQFLLSLVSKVSGIYIILRFLSG